MATAPKTRKLERRYQPGNGRKMSARRTWQKLATSFVDQYPLCVLCLCQGNINQGAAQDVSRHQRNLVVDHVAPHKGDEAAFWRFSNLQVLCRYPCHDSYKQRFELQGGHWWEHMRRLIRDNHSQTLVDSMVRLLPDHIRAEICTGTS